MIVCAYEIPAGRSSTSGDGGCGDGSSGGGGGVIVGGSAGGESGVDQSFIDAHLPPCKIIRDPPLYQPMDRLTY